ncbi:MAG: tripartite tricarboxylate transporter TctB family protein [Parcubacteria group bacterium]|nr:tripartite tricarboxylate transporter TctB family protein [Parcubacteria group bacterium]
MRQNSKADIVAAICLSLVSFLVFWISKGFPSSKTGIGVNAFPKLLAGLLIIFSIIIIIQAIKNSSFSKKEPIFKEFKKGHKLIIAVIIILIIYIQMLEVLGFILSSFLLLITLMFIFGERRKIILLLVPLLFSVILYLVFSKMAMVFLPEGIIENFFF